MNEQEKFFEWLDDWCKSHPIETPSSLEIWQACANRYQVELETLRGFAQSIESIDFTRFNDSAFAQNFVRKTMKLHKLIDESGNPTPLLTGVNQDAASQPRTALAHDNDAWQD